MKPELIKIILISISFIFSYSTFPQSNINLSSGNISINEVEKDAIIISTPKGDVTINKIFNNVKNTYEWKLSDEDRKKFSTDIAWTVKNELTGILDSIKMEIQKNNIILQADKEKKITMKNYEIDSLKREITSLQCKVIDLQDVNQYISESIINKKNRQSSHENTKNIKVRKDKTWQKEPYTGYFGWTCIGGCYNGFYGTNISQNSISSEFFGRYGNVMGWGFSVQAGYSFGSYNKKNDDKELYASITAKYFPFKFIYCGIAVNMIGKYHGTDIQMGDNGTFRIDVFDKNVFGISLLTGIEQFDIFDEDAVVGIYGSLSGGITYMPIVKSITSTIRISFSIVSLGTIIEKRQISLL